MPKFNNVELTEESMQKARDWFASNAQACIDEVTSGRVKVNDREGYFAWCLERMYDALAGRSDHTFALLQRAHTFQTGECIAFLP